MSLLDRGIKYKDNNNLFNSILVYSKALKNSLSIEDLAILRMSAADIYLKLGLYEIAYKQIENCISILENNLKSPKRDSNYLLLCRFDKAYACRAELNFIMGNTNEFKKDIEQSNLVNPYYKNSSLDSEYIFFYKAIELFKNNHLKELNAFIEETLSSLEKNYFLVFEENFLYTLFYSSSSKIYECLNDLEKSSIYMKKASELKGKSIFYKYSCGRLFYLMNQKKESNKIIQELYSRSKYRLYLTPFKDSVLKKGVIILLNENQGELITQTVFSEWDSIRFELKNPNNLKIGDVVSFNLKYILIDNQNVGFAENLKKINEIQQMTIKYKFIFGNQISYNFHCIIKPINSALKKITLDNIYCYSFYPFESFISLNSIMNFISSEMIDEIQRKKFVFVELQVNSLNEITSIQNIAENNSFNELNHPKRLLNEKKKKSRNQYQPIRRVKYSSCNNENECSICQLNEWCGTDGCPLDPQ